MFDLETSIAGWRREMSDGGVDSSAALDELESHLCDDVEQRISDGLSAQRAFEIATQEIGTPYAISAEFNKLPKMNTRIKGALLTLAGIPNQYLADSNGQLQSRLNGEPPWVAYLRASIFMSPGVFLWMISAIFFVPKLQQLCVDANLFAFPDIWNVAHANILTTLFFKNYGVALVGGMILAVFLLEWRGCRWARYRRAVIGVGSFVFNSIVLCSIFMMIVTAVFAAAELHQHAK